MFQEQRVPEAKAGTAVEKVQSPITEAYVEGEVDRAIEKNFKSLRELGGKMSSTLVDKVTLSDVREWPIKKQREYLKDTAIRMDRSDFDSARFEIEKEGMASLELLKAGHTVKTGGRLPIYKLAAPGDRSFGADIGPEDKDVLVDKVVRHTTGSESERSLAMDMITSGRVTNAFEVGSVLVDGAGHELKRYYYDYIPRLDDQQREIPRANMDESDFVPVQVIKIQEGEQGSLLTKLKRETIYIMSGETGEVSTVVRFTDKVGNTREVFYDAAGKKKSDVYRRKVQPGSSKPGLVYAEFGGDGISEKVKQLNVGGDLASVDIVAGPAGVGGQRFVTREGLNEPSDPSYRFVSHTSIEFIQNDLI